MHAYAFQPHRLAGLAQEHRDLDETIAFLAVSGLPDALLIARLKKRKLRIRDEIARLAAALPVAAG